MRLKVTTTLKAGDELFEKNKIFDDSKKEIPEVIMNEYTEGRGTVINLDDPSSTPKPKSRKSEAQLLKEKLLGEKKAAKAKKRKKKPGPKGKPGPKPKKSKKLSKK